MAQRRVTVGVAIAALALLGWVATQVATPLAQKPRTVEDLTAAWTEAGPTRLGQPTTVSVPRGQTLVAFLVGTGLYGTAGTSTGSCAASSEGPAVDLAWPVLIDRSLSGVLAEGQETVAIAGWANHTDGPVRVEIRCDSVDSGVDHYVAIPTRTAVLVISPWFANWPWIILAAIGVGLIASGTRWINPPNR